MQMFAAHRCSPFSRPLARRKRTAVLCLVLTCVLLDQAGAQEPSRSSLTDLTSGIDALVEQQIKSYNIPGLSIAVAQQGKIVFSRAYGWADLESKTPVTTETLFRIGSITKPISATATMILAEKNQLALDAPVQRYCSAFPEKPWPVTSRELLAHLGGVRAFRSQGGVQAELFSNTHYERVADSLSLFANDPLVAQPGTRYEYSNYGYDLIGCVLEGASGKQFDELLRDIIFVPAIMTSTTVDDSTRVVAGRSRSYTHAKDGSVRNATSIDTSNRISAAGLLSTANDLERFALALESGKLLPAAAVRQMWTEQTMPDGKRTAYALGWMIHNHNGTSVVAHTGEQPGSSTILCILPGQHSSFTILANTDAAGLWKLADKLIDVLLGKSLRIHAGEGARQRSETNSISDSVL